MGSNSDSFQTVKRSAPTTHLRSSLTTPPTHRYAFPLLALVLPPRWTISPPLPSVLFSASLNGHEKTSTRVLFRGRLVCASLPRRKEQETEFDVPTDFFFFPPSLSNPSYT